MTPTLLVQRVHKSTHPTRTSAMLHVRSSRLPVRVVGVCDGARDQFDAKRVWVNISGRSDGLDFQRLLCQTNQLTLGHGRPGSRGPKGPVNYLILTVISVQCCSTCSTTHRCKHIEPCWAGLPGSYASLPFVDSIDRLTSPPLATFTSAAPCPLPARPE